MQAATDEQRAQYATSAFGIHWAELDEDLSFEGFFKPKKRLSKIGQVFARADEINVSAFACKMGLAQPLMADYLSGKKTPGEKRTKDIEAALHKLGAELMAVEL